MFTRDPLKWLLQYDGLTSFGNYIYEGRPLGNTHGFDEPTTVILRNLCNKIPSVTTMMHPLDYELLMNGIKNGQNAWPPCCLDDTWAFIRPSKNM